MSDKFLASEKPKNETDNGWIEYAILKFWEDCQPRDEHIADNAAAETETLRQQLAEANGIINRLCLAVAYNKTSSGALLEAQKSAYEYLDKVASAQPPHFVPPVTPAKE